MHQLPDPIGIISHSLEQVFDGILVTDGEQRLLYFNQAAERLWGYRRQEIIGQPSGLLFDAPLQATRKTAHETIIRRQDGSCRWVNQLVSRVLLDDQTFYCAFIKDCTTQRRQEAERELQRAGLDSTENALLITDPKGHILLVNDGFSRNFGWDTEQILGYKAIDLLLPETVDKDQLVNHVCQLLAHGRGYHKELQLVGKHQAAHWFSLMLNPLPAANGKPRHLLGLLTNISSSKLQDTLMNNVLHALSNDVPLQESMALFCREIAQTQPDLHASILHLDEQGLLYHVYPQLQHSPLQHQPLDDAMRICPPEQRQASGSSRWFAQGFIDGFEQCLLLRIRSSNGHDLGLLVMHYRQRNQHGEPHERLLENCHQLISLALERETTRRRIRQLNLHDSLTGLANFRLFQINTAAFFASTTQDTPHTALMLIGLDRFKQLNDNLGQIIGDAVLCRVAHLLEQFINPGDHLARLHTDQFVILLDQADADKALLTAQRIAKRIQSSHNLKGISLTLCASIGISLFPSHGQELSILLHNASQALQHAKSTAPGSIVFYSDNDVPSS